MDITTHLHRIINFFQANPYVGLLVLAALAIQAYRKPKEIFKLLGFCVFLIIVMYCLMLFFGTISTGTKQKERMIYKSREAIGE